MMKYVLDHNAILYVLEQFPRSIAPDLWKAFNENCKNGVLVSHCEALKLLQQDAVERESIEWSKENSPFFKKTTTAEAALLGEIMEKEELNFFETPALAQRRLPVAIPFIICMAKIQNRCFVYRKNTNADFLAKTKRVCEMHGIKHLEIENCLMNL